MTAQQRKAERVLAEALFNAPIWAEDEDGLQWPEDWRAGERQVDAIARVVVAALPEPICTSPAHVELEKAARRTLDLVARVAHQPESDLGAQVEYEPAEGEPDEAWCRRYLGHPAIQRYLAIRDAAAAESARRDIERPWREVLQRYFDGDVPDEVREQARALLATEGQETSEAQP